jgi:hypothetical protein
LEFIGMPETSRLKSRDTLHLNKSDSPQRTDAQIVKPASNITLAPWKIILHIGADSLIAVRLEVAQQLIMGRADIIDGHRPGLDLSPYGAQDAGVSRRHAVLVNAEDGLYICDLISTNGTHVNGYGLQPNKLYKLNRGDRIECGKMHITLQVMTRAG